MLGPTRPLPRLGCRARIRHFGGEVEVGVVCAVHDSGRRVEVRCGSGEMVIFALSPATAKFMLAGSAHGAEMDLLDGAEGDLSPAQGT
jgi:hypothetical protein